MQHYNQQVAAKTFMNVHPVIRTRFLMTVNAN